MLAPLFNQIKLFPSWLYQKQTWIPAISKTSILIITVSIFTFTEPVKSQAPCSGVPAISTLTLSSNLICPNNSITIGTTGNYSLSGFLFSLNVSTLSSVGPFTTVAQNTVGTFTSQAFSSGPVWLSVQITCTNGNTSTFLTAVQLNIRDLLITTNSATTCPNTTATLTAASSSSINWYNSLTSTLSLASGPSFTIQPTTSGTSTLYAEATNSCFIGSNRVPVVLNVLPSPTLSAPNGTICNGQSFSITPSGATTYTYPFSVSPTITTSYPVYGTNTLGCASSITVLVTKVNANPPLISAPGAVICEGNSHTIVPTGGVSYVFPNSNVVTPGPGTTFAFYTFKGTDANGCTSNAVCAVTVAPRPVIFVNGGTICKGNTFTLNPTGASTYSYSSNIPVVSPNSTTSYTITGFDSMGCASLPNLVYVVVTTSSPNISVASSSICEGESYTLAPTGALNYTILSSSFQNPMYTNGAVVISPSMTANYTVVGINSGNCTNQAVATISVDPLPIIILSSSKNPICFGEIVKLTAQGAFAYSWNNWVASPTATINLGPSSTTSVTVIGKSVWGCSVTAVTTITVDACEVTDINENSTLNFIVYPNPSHGFITINSLIKTEITLMNAIGQLIQKQTVQIGANKIDISEQAKGVYFIVFSNNLQKTPTKVVKH